MGWAVEAVAEAVALSAADAERLAVAAGLGGVTGNALAAVAVGAAEGRAAEAAEASTWAMGLAPRAPDMY